MDDGRLMSTDGDAAQPTWPPESDAGSVTRSVQHLTPLFQAGRLNVECWTMTTRAFPVVGAAVWWSS